MPQVLATFLAFGVLTNFLRLGLLRYWQRQGFCCLILVQHIVDGGVEEVIAPAQGLSSVGLHVTAIETSALPNSTTTTRYNAIAMYEYDAFIFTQLSQSHRETERLATINYAWLG